MTEDEFQKMTQGIEKSIPEEIKEKVKKMTDEDAEARYEELREKTVPAIPIQLGLESPEPKAFEDLQEYFLLKKRFGYIPGASS